MTTSSWDVSINKIRTYKDTLDYFYQYVEKPFLIYNKTDWGKIYQILIDFPEEDYRDNIRYNEIKGLCYLYKGDFNNAKKCYLFLTIKRDISHNNMFHFINQLITATREKEAREIIENIDVAMNTEEFYIYRSIKAYIDKDIKTLNNNLAILMQQVFSIEEYRYKNEVLQLIDWLARLTVISDNFSIHSIEKAIMILRDAITIGSPGYIQSRVYNNIGFCYVNLGGGINYHSALEYFDKASAIRHKLGDIIGMMSSAQNYINCKSVLSDNLRDLEYLENTYLSLEKEAMNINLDHIYLQVTLLNLVDLYIRMGKNNSAIITINKIDKKNIFPDNQLLYYTNSINISLISGNISSFINSNNTIKLYITKENKKDEEYDAWIEYIRINLISIIVYKVSEHQEYQSVLPYIISSAQDIASSSRYDFYLYRVIALYHIYQDNYLDAQTVLKEIQKKDNFSPYNCGEACVWLTLAYIRNGDIYEAKATEEKARYLLEPFGKDIPVLKWLEQFMEEIPGD